MATITASASGGTRAWSDSASWVSGVVPGASDNVQLTATSGSITIAATTACRSLDCTGYTGTLTHNAAITLTIGDSTAGLSSVALTLVAGMTYTLGSATTSAIVFASTSATQQTVTTGGKTLGGVTFSGAGSSYLLSDTDTTGTVTHTAGTLATGGQTCSWGSYVNAGTATRTLTMGASPIAVTGTGTVWSIASATGMTLTANTATISISNTSSTDKTFAGAGLTYGTLSLSGGPGKVTITGANSFYDIITNPETQLVLPASTTTTIRNTSSTFGSGGTNYGYQYCFLPDTRMMFWSGLKKVSDATDTEAVYQTDGAFHEIQGRHVTDYDGEVVHIKARGMLEAGVTADHDVLRVQGKTVRGWKSRRKSYEQRYGFGTYETNPVIRNRGNARSLDLTPEWVHASELVAGDYLLLPRPQITDRDVTLEFPSLGFYARRLNAITGTVVPLDEEWAEIFGWWVAEGSFSRQNSGAICGLVFSLSGDEMHVAERLAKLLKHKAGSSSCIQKIKGHHTIRLTASGTSLAQFMESNFGSGAHHKRVPLWMLESRLNILRSFVIAYADGDGHRRVLNGNASLRLVTVSEQLVTGLVTGLMRFGIAPTIGERPAGPKHDFTVGISGEDVATVYGEPPEGGSPHYLKDDNYFYLPVTRLTSEHYVGPVYDFTSETHTLGLPWIAHNCHGISGNYASTPDAAPLRVTGDIDLRCQVALDNWSVSQILVGKWGASGQLSYDLYISAGKLALALCADGTTVLLSPSSVSTGFTNGTTHWVRVTWKQSTSTATFYTSSDGVTWTQLGTTTTLTLASIFNSTAVLEIGSQNTGVSNPASGKFYRAQVYNGIAGTLVFDANFATKPFPSNSFTESSSNAATVTINGQAAQAGDGRVLIASSTPGTAATISCASGTVSINNASLQDSTATGGAFFTATNSIQVSNDTGWSATIPATVSIVASAGGAPAVAATATASISISATATGSPAPAATPAGIVSIIANPFSGKPTVAIAPSGAISLLASAVGAPVVTVAPSASLTVVAGTVSGASAVSAIPSATVSLLAVAGGSPAIVATASASVSILAPPPPATGSATGTVGIIASATAGPGPSASPSAALSVVAASSGTPSFPVTPSAFVTILAMATAHPGEYAARVFMSQAITANFSSVALTAS